MKLRDNKWGFDLKLDNPFRIFRVLRHIADESVGADNVVDVSRGDPGYGYCPSVRGREFYAFLLEVDTVFNNPGEHFAAENREDFEVLWERIQAHAKKTYSEKKANQLTKEFYFFLTRIEKFSNEQGLNWSKREILAQLFNYSIVSGGSYIQPPGETLVKAVVADHYNKRLDLGVDYSEVLLMQGVSHGIGTIFKFLNDKKVGYLKEGDGVLVNSPVYAPYNAIIENRGLKSYSIPIDPETGKVVGDIDEILAATPENLKLICLIDPNNPTGFMNDDEFLRKIAAFAEERDILIVTDEVYSDFFFERQKNVIHYARKRTIMIGGRSKIERSTGLRFGEFVISKEAQEYIGDSLLGGNWGPAPDLMCALVFAKAPGGIEGEFQHVTFVTAPSQFMGISHMIFGDDDRDEYLKRIRVNMESFYAILGLEYRKNLYYSCFDLAGIPGFNKEDMEPEELFVGLAKKGIVLIPANLFFSESEREKKDYRSFARASLPNVTFSYLQKGAKLVKEYVTG
jgi:aspartate/methionine/tyrosine aminotransferase